MVLPALCVVLFFERFVEKGNAVAGHDTHETCSQKVMLWKCDATVIVHIALLRVHLHSIGLACAPGLSG